MSSFIRSRKKNGTLGEKTVRMKEIIIENGKNIIKYVDYNIFNYLIISNVVNASNWKDNIGTIAEYYSVTDYSINKKNELTSQLDHFLIDGKNEERIESIKNFINLFSNGIYSISFNNENISYEQILNNNVDNSIKNENFHGWFHVDIDYEYYYIYTAQRHKLNKERILHYEKSIKEGNRPAILTIGNNRTRYIIDGHHKLEAYISLGIDIPIFNISKLSSEVLVIEEELNVLHQNLSTKEFENLFLNYFIDKVNYFERPEFDIILDRILKNSKEINKNIGELFLRTYNSKIKNENEWFYKRLRALKENHNIGKGFYLPYKYFSEKGVFIWKSYPIVYSSNFDEWLQKLKIN